MNAFEEQQKLAELQNNHQEIWDNLTGKTDVTKSLDAKLNVDISISKTSIQDLNKARRQKKDWRLYPIYQGLKGMLEKCQPTIDELFQPQQKLVPKTEGLDDEKVLVDVWERTPTANIFADISDENEQLIESIYNSWIEVKDRPDQIRDRYVKDKVMQDRFTKKGQAYVMEFEEVGNLMFALSALVTDFQVRLHEKKKKSGELND